MLNCRHYTRVLVAIVVVLIAAVVATAATQTFTGVLSDSMCGAKHMVPGKTDAECTRYCVKAGAKYAVVVDKKVYTLAGPQDQLSPLAGKRVRITGEKSGDTITVKTISSEK